MSIGIEATVDGAPFAVFDFGGGTTDFAYGVYRLARPDETENEGWDEVLDILDSYGDENLGGEHLLDLLAFEAMRANAATCQAEGIVFACPANFSPFSGSELLFAHSVEAMANLNILREALRPLWEEGRLPDEDTGTLSLTLRKRDGGECPVKLGVDGEALLGCLRSRIDEGVDNFFAGFAQAFKLNGISPQKLHVLLAGNSCRSPLAREAFEARKAEITPTEKDAIQIHYEMLDENGQNGGPSLKTGVALGLVRLLPGGPVGENRICQKDEAPFPFTVGYFRQDKLVKVMERNEPYNGGWRKLMRLIRAGVAVLGYSDAAGAMEKDWPKAKCKVLRVDLGAENAGRQIFVRAVGPDTIALTLGSDDGPDADFGERYLTLKH